MDAILAALMSSDNVQYAIGGALITGLIQLFQYKGWMQKMGISSKWLLLAFSALGGTGYAVFTIYFPAEWQAHVTAFFSASMGYAVLIHQFLVRPVKERGAGRG